jgi:hypothetical protein
VIIDTTVQEKAITFPTDAKLMHRARERLVRLAQKHGVRLRQSYARVGKIALHPAPALWWATTSDSYSGGWPLLWAGS